MTNKGNILIVDDSTETLALLTELLNAEGYSTYPANSGELALVYITKRQPDLILLDIRMPGLNGFEVCKQIKKNHALIEIPIIFLTADSNINDKIEGLKLGAADYITKPFEKEELLARVKIHLGLYTFQKLFKTRTAGQLLEKEQLLLKQNNEYCLLNEKLEGSLFEIDQINKALEEKHEECIIINKNLISVNAKLNNANKSLKENEKQLNELNSTKDKLISIIAHDLRSPFNSILGLTLLLKTNLKTYDFSKTERMLSQVHDVANNTFNLLNDLLTWALNQTGQISYNPEKININTFLTELVTDMSSNAILKNITLNYIQSSNIYVHADTNMLNTIVRNLISNAIKFTHPGGKIDIMVLLINEQIEISVADNGIGMKQDDVEKLFKMDSFLKTKGTDNESGSGLGLLLCKEFIEKHGGEIWVKSEINKGSTFYFTLKKAENI